jgi:co-chaperonin GroES (HSP10)
MINLSGAKVAVVPVYDPPMIGHIIVPDIAKTRSDQGIVKYIGPDVKDIEVGDYVLFSGYTGTLLFLEDEGRLIIMHEDFIVAKIDPPDNLQTTNVPGLFFKSKNGEYFEATYEMTMDLVADMITNSEFRKTFKSSLGRIENRDSKRTDYEFFKDRG